MFHGSMVFGKNTVYPLFIVVSYGRVSLSEAPSMSKSRLAISGPYFVGCGGGYVCTNV